MLSTPCTVSPARFLRKKGRGSSDAGGEWKHCRAEVTLHFVPSGCKLRKTGLRLNCETLRRESCFMGQPVGEMSVVEYNGLEN